MKTPRELLIVVLAAFALTAPSHAASVTWSAPAAITGAGNIVSAGVTGIAGANFGITTGTTTTVTAAETGTVAVEFKSLRSGQNATLANGINVAAASTWGNWGPASNISSITGNFGIVLDSNLGIEAPTTSAIITLSGLTIGTQYQIQFFADHNGSATNSQTISGSGTMNTLNGKYVTGTFTADAISQDLTVSWTTGHAVANALTIGVVPATGTITATGSLSPFTTNVGTASAAQSTVSVSGSGLTANIAANAPSGFEVSADGTAYAGTATFTQSSGSVASTPLYVRLSAAAAVGSYSGNIVLSSAGATSVNVAASGTVNPPPGNGTWILNDDGDWSTNVNWSGNQIADAVGGTANFTTAFTTGRTVTLDSNRTLGILNLSATGGNLNIVSSGAVLTLDNTGSTAAQINTTTTSPQYNRTLGTVPLELKDSLVINQNVSNGSGKDLTLGSISSTNGSLTIQHNSTFVDGQTNFDGIISNGTGTIAFTQTNGRSIFNAINTYTGATTLSGGTLKLGATGALDIATSVSIAAGAILDLTAPTELSATYLWNAASLSASGAASPATIAGTAGGTIDMGITPISVTTNATTPCLTVTGASLALGGNQFTVVTASPLTAGVYTLVSAASSISGSVNPTALYGGSGLAGGASGVVSISGSDVVLTVTGGAAVTVTGSLTAFTTIAGTASAPQSTVSVSGSNLTGNLIATAPAGFEVSSDGTTYAGTATFTPSGGEIASTPLYVRLSAAAAAGSYMENVTVTSTGANTVTVVASGKVYPLPGDGTWTQDGNSTWSTYANWAGEVIADGVGKSGTFTLALSSSNKTVTLDSNRTLGVWNLGQTGRSLNFVNSGGSVLTLDHTGSTNAVINVANGGRNIAAGTLPVELTRNPKLSGFWLRGGGLGG